MDFTFDAGNNRGIEKARRDTIPFSEVLPPSALTPRTLMPALMFPPEFNVSDVVTAISKFNLSIGRASPFTSKCRPCFSQSKVGFIIAPLLIVCWASLTAPVISDKAVFINSFKSIYNLLSISKLFSPKTSFSTWSFLSFLNLICKIASSGSVSFLVRSIYWAG